VERELLRENTKVEDSENSKESQLMKPNNGSLRNALELLYELFHLSLLSDRTGFAAVVFRCNIYFRDNHCFLWLNLFGLF
jgi:hypothetical protein